ncbi:TFIID-31kDa-domain-containing protein, partial [Saccharata proteae CBS 121410]
PQQPPSSLSDSGLSKRPRDARLLHMVLAHLGVSAYQERVPLQLMDFAYRYTADILGEAVRITESAASVGTKGGAGAGKDEGTVTLAAIRSAIAAKLNNQYSSNLPKDFLLEMAQEKNRVGLPRAERDFGVRLPPERYCFTGAGWGLKDEWESETEASGDEPDETMEDVREGGDENEANEEDDFE